MDITAAANVAAGQVVAGANTVPVYICHEAITSGDKGSVGSWWRDLYVNTATNVANNELVYWDDTEKDVSNSNANGAAFGYVVPDGAVSAGSKTYVIHQPFPLLG